ncbi:hypothetical protein CIK05_01855 [Bdellovibrio sp. qaytius]|nr:hypothetical protein CIK05_01855 [Bdellovibrio sp. qaytius]
MKPILVIGLLSLTAALPAAAQPKKNCAVAYASGDSCKNLRVDFNLKDCAMKAPSKKPTIHCDGSKATASVESEKWIFRTNLKRFIGKNSSIWDVSGDVQFSEKKIERIVAAVTSAPVSVSTTAMVSSAITVVAVAPAAPMAPTAEPFTPSWKNNSLIQFWYLEDQTKSAIAADTNFRVRRAELKLTGSSAENTRWFLVADFAKSLSTNSTSVLTSGTTKTTINDINTTGDNKILQDIGIAFKLAPDLEVTLGQFKLPTTAESMQSTSELLFAERSLLTRTYGERRDPGAMLTYKYEKIKASLAMSNGQGANVDEKNDRKDYSGRIEATLPWGFTVGTFTLCKDAICSDPNRYGISLNWASTDYYFRSEYVNSNVSQVRSTAYVLDGGYKLTEQWQVAARYDSLKPNLVNSFTSTAATVGVNYFYSKQNLKLQLNHTQLFNMKGNNGSYSSSADQKGSLIIFAVQNNF